MSTVATPSSKAVPIRHVVKGEFVDGDDVVHAPRDGRAFSTPKLDLNQLVWPRAEPIPALNVPVAEVIDLLVATGERLASDPDGLLAQACELMTHTSPYERRIVENSFEDLPRSFEADRIRFQIDQELGGPEVVDGWRLIERPDGKTAKVRAFPARVVHIVAGNTPSVSAWSFVMGAVTKGMNLYKLPSNDLFTLPAIIGTMAAVSPGHPITQSASAVYWRGGDESVESVLFRPQYFDKIAAWGGEGTIKGVGKYMGPGLELIAFDPKTSVSLIGREALIDDETIESVARLAAEDATSFNQETCSSSRFQFIEGDLDRVDQFCAALARLLPLDRRYSSATGRSLPGEAREEIDMLRQLGAQYRVWGNYDGGGLVVRSDEPVEFHPTHKTVNVVRVDSLKGAARFANVATQTVGVYPPERKDEIRDLFASVGVQRIVSLGDANSGYHGLPHDGFRPLHRLVRWIGDQD
jgi:hypothetical protein